MARVPALLTAVVAAVLVGALCAPAEAVAEPERHGYVIWQWNVAGSAIHHGSTTDGLIGVAAGSIEDRKATLASLNEICYVQYAALRDRLRADGWLADPDNFSRFAATEQARPGLCGGHGAYGNAIFSTGALDDARTQVLPSDGRTEQRVLVCARLRDTPLVRFCTTHITTSSDPAGGGHPTNANQLDAVLATMEDYHAAGDTVLLDGDLNAQPGYARLRNWYAPDVDTLNNAGNTGAYHELDDDDPGNCPGYGEWTSDSPDAAPGCAVGQPNGKIDMIFVRADRLAPGYSADALDTALSCATVPAAPGRPAGACSDHRILVGTATMITYPPGAERR